MKRWNGWGSELVDYPVSSGARNYLAKVIGQATPQPSARFDDILRLIPPGKLPVHPLVSSETSTRLRHSRGQSLPDWIALRYGAVDRVPDGVARPASEKEVRELLAFARSSGAVVIPYGGGTSVVGHINPPPGQRPVLTLDMSRLFRMTQLDDKSYLATFGAGVTGPHLEAQLRARGLMLGHFPQSFEYSTLGGWIATRSCGQQSIFYGRIEDLFAGARLMTPEGLLELPPFPASAAGPDLRQLVLGSEGRLGVLTQATVRVVPLADRERFHAVFFADWKSGMAAIKEIVLNALPVSMLRLTDAIETKTTLALAGHERLIRLLERLLHARGIENDKCLLLLGITGGHESIPKTRRLAFDIAQTHGGIYVGRRFGKEWRKNRFLTPYLRNTLWDVGYAVDTLESAFTWENVPRAAEAVLKNLRTGLVDSGEKVLAFAHISSVYRTGASLYFTCIFRLATDAQGTLSRWRKLKAAASSAILANGGTISHQHGVGIDHLPYLRTEKGELGIRVLRSLTRALDPEGIMNPGKLVSEKDEG